MAYAHCQARPLVCYIRVFEINQNATATLWAEAMGLILLAHEIILQTRLGVVEPNNVFAHGINEKIACYTRVNSVQHRYA